MPWGVRLLAIAIAAYAFSPIDLIPDFIPILGYLDDLLIVPLGLWLVVKLTPPAVMDAARVRAREVIERPRGWGAMVIIIGIWLVLAALFVWWAWGRWHRPTGPT